MMQFILNEIEWGLKKATPDLPEKQKKDRDSAVKKKQVILADILAKILPYVATHD